MCSCTWTGDVKICDVIGIRFFGCRHRLRASYHNFFAEWSPVERSAIMKLTLAALSLVNCVAAFSISPAFHRARQCLTKVCIGRDPNVQLGGNDWKPDSAGMRVSSLVCDSGIWPHQHYQKMWLSSWTLGEECVVEKWREWQPKYDKT